MVKNVHDRGALEPGPGSQFGSGGGTLFGDNDDDLLIGGGNPGDVLDGGSGTNVLVP